MDEEEEFICGPHITILSEETIIEETGSEDSVTHSILEVSSKSNAISNDFDIHLECPGETKMNDWCKTKLAARLLQSVPESKCRRQPLKKPKHGDWFIFSYKGDMRRRRLWHKDGLEWQSCGLKKEYHFGATLHKRHFRATSSGLTRLVFEVVEPVRLSRLFVQYIDQSRMMQRINNQKKRADWQPKPPPVKVTISSQGATEGDVNSKLLSSLSDRRAAELLLADSHKHCSHTPLEKPSNGFWYIYKYDNDPALSIAWQDDGLMWEPHSSSTVAIGSALMLKRQYVRHIDGAPVDFQRYTYEFVDPAVASLLGLGENGGVEETITNDVKTRASFEWGNGEGDGNESENRSITPKNNNNNKKVPRSSSVNKKQGLNKRNKENASKNVGVNDESIISVIKEERETVDFEVTEDSINSSYNIYDEDHPTEYPLHRVLIHYLGHTDALLVTPRALKRFSRSSNETPQPALCRAVPLMCSFGTLHASIIGNNPAIHRPLSLQEALHVLTTTTSAEGLRVPYPRAGMWCLHELPAGGLSWACDGFTWRCLSQGRHIVGDRVVLYKKYRRVLEGASMHLYRLVYSVPDVTPYRVLVHYVGLEDEPGPKQPVKGVLSTKFRKKVPEFETGFKFSDEWTVLPADEEAQLGKSLTVTALSRGGLSVMVVTRLSRQLQVSTILHLLEHTPEEDCLTFAPDHPKNGHWYVFSYSGVHPSFEHLWKKDSYRWRHNGTRKNAYNGQYWNTRYFKRMFSNDESAKFMRYTHELTDLEGNNIRKRMLVHYLGKDDYCERAAESKLNKHSKEKLGIDTSVIVKVGTLGEGQFQVVQCDKFEPDYSDGTEPIYEAAPELEDPLPPTAKKSRRKTVEITPNGDASNSFCYEEIVSSDVDKSSVPANVIDEVSVRYVNDETDTSVDSGLPYVYRIENVGLESTEDFLQKIKETHLIFFQLIPTTIVIIACKNTMKEFKSFSMKEDPLNILYYDRLWKINGIFVTCLYTHHPHCQNEGLFPLAYAVYELDDSRTHTVVLENLLSHYRTESSGEIILLTDASHGVLNACLDVLPEGMKPAASWTNIIESVKFWFSKNDPTNESCPTVVESVTELLKSRNITEYNKHYSEASSDWTADFKSFYDLCLNQIVITSNTENLEALDLYSEYGLTIRGSRDFIGQMNNVFVDAEGSTVDNLTHLAYYMLFFYNNEIEKGKLLKVGTIFKRKCEYFIPSTKKKCFFPSRCSVSEDLAAAILHRMQVPLITPKKEPPSMVIEDIPQQDNVLDLCNIEIDLDNTIVEEDAKRYTEFTDIEIDERELSDDNEAPVMPLSKVEINPKSRFFYNKSAPVSTEKVVISLNASNPMPSRHRSRNKSFHQILHGSQKLHGSKLYLRRKKLASIGHSLWSSGCVWQEPNARHVFTVTSHEGRSNREDDFVSSRSDSVTLHPQRSCSCQRKRGCPHVVAALLESFCLEQDGYAGHSSSFTGNSYQEVSAIEDLSASLNDDEEEGQLHVVDVPETLENGIVFEGLLDDEHCYDVTIG